MDVSITAFLGPTPPPPLPSRILTYEPPSALHSLRQLANMKASTGSNSWASPRAGPSSRTAGTIHQAKRRAASQDSAGRSNQQTYSSAVPLPPNLQTWCFYDHLERFALMVLASEPSLALSAPSPPPCTQTSRRSTSSTVQKPSVPTSLTPLACGMHFDLREPQISIQLYLHDRSPAFNNEHGVRSVDYWCRQLQFSAAFHYLRHQLRKYSGKSQTSPTIRIEAYDALPAYSSIINHSLNEREYRGLQECSEYTKRFLQHMKKRASTPDFAVSDTIVSKGEALLQNRVFLEEQMEDIQNGDGGKNRRRRAALRNQFAPAFDDGSGPEGSRETATNGPAWSFNRPQTSEDPLVPRAAWSLAHVQSASLQSTQQFDISPGQDQHYADAQHNHQSLSPSLEPSLQPWTSLQQNQQQQSPVRSHTPQQPNLQGQNRPSSDGQQSNPASMPPPPTPTQGWQRATPSQQPAGSVANPFKPNPYPLHIKSIYRGVSQPYHNMVLVIDQPQQILPNIGVLRFGYESDWAKGESIQRSGACFERVSMTKGTGSRWLGDALVECFLGDASEHHACRSSHEDENGDAAGSRPTWPPGGERHTDADLGLDIQQQTTGKDSGLGFGIDLEQMDHETARMLKKLSVPGAENVDFLDEEWCELL